MVMSGSTLPVRALGKRLQYWRNERNITQTVASRAMAVSLPTMQRFEEGRRPTTSLLEITALADLYDLDAEERARLLSLLEETKEARKAGPNWWRDYGDAVGRDFDHYVSLEDSARQLTDWQISIIPGLLQTADYRRILAKTENPDWTETQIGQRLDLTRQRQKRLQDEGFQLDFLIGEGCLRQAVGGTPVMSTQLEQLLELSHLPNLRLRVVPFSTERPIGQMAGSFTLLEFPMLRSTKEEAPPVVFIEEYAGILYLERSAEIARYRNAAVEIAGVALDESQTRSLIGSIREEVFQ